MAAEIRLVALSGLPMVQPGDDLVELLTDRLEGQGDGLSDGDILVLAQKIVSKAENRFVDLREVTPSERALELGRAVDKDPRLVEVILRESRAVVRHRPGVLVVENHYGLVLANAGVDHSNVSGNDEIVLLLPRDPDASAAALRDGLRGRLGIELGVVIADSLGRAWRLGTVGCAIGCAGVESFLDLRGDGDLFGRELRVSTVGHADQIAAAASILLGQGAEGTPAVLLQGLSPSPRPLPATALVRPGSEDLFR